jgi:F-type H+-transporting ATPase subunit b
MNDFIFLAALGTDLAQMAQDTARTFGVDWPHFISQVISFGIVAVLLQRYAYKPILKILDERRIRIAEGLANAERIKVELAKTEAARQDVLEQANVQANRLIEEARAAAARLQEQESQKAIAAAEQTLARAREAAAQDQARMLAELKREVGRLVVLTTARVLGKVLTPEDQQRLAQEAAQQLAG